MNNHQVHRNYYPRQKFSYLLVPLLFCLLILTSGCVRYDVGINFAGQHRGVLVQHITLDEELTSFSQAEARKWLQSVEERANKLQGRTKQISEQEIEVQIPFSNGEELATKFNQIFDPQSKKNNNNRANQIQSSVPLQSHLELHQSNLLILERNKLNLNLDLRGIGVLSDSADVVVNSTSLLAIQFILKTPWGAKSLTQNPQSIPAEVQVNGRKLVWQLHPGEINSIEAVFWIPSYLGLGTILIALLVIFGFYFKYKRFPWQIQLPDGN